MVLGEILVSNFGILDFPDEFFFFLQIKRMIPTVQAIASRVTNPIAARTMIPTIMRVDTLISLVEEDVPINK